MDGVAASAEFSHVGHFPWPVRGRFHTRPDLREPFGVVSHLWYLSFLGSTNPRQ
jgi:hypothetical protein